MKKVLLLAVVVFGAVLAQAAWCSWSLTFATNDAQDWQDNGAMVMMFAGSAFTDVKECIATNTGNTLKSALMGKTLLDYSGDSSIMTFAASSDEIAETWSITTTLPDDGQAFWMIFTDSNFTAETTVYWMDVVEANSRETLTEDYFTNTATIGKIAEEYAAVPEPGVMALLALGVAGLALRRKVA